MDWIPRATHFAEEALSSVGGESWVISQRRRKWRWAGRVARLADERWTLQTLLWEPLEGSRGVGRPMLRWTDAFVSYFNTIHGANGHDWMLYAQQPEAWHEHEE